MERPVFDAAAPADEAGGGSSGAATAEPRSGGWPRTFDQFANLLLEHTVERHILAKEKLYADVYFGTMLVRGENVCLFGEIDTDRGNDTLREAPLAFVLQQEA